MLGLSLLHGITVHFSCVNAGFDWRSRNLNPDLVQSYGKAHVRDRDAALARQSMLTYYRARLMRPLDMIPTKQSDHDKTQIIQDGSVAVADSVQYAPGNPGLFMMPPGKIHSLYINRNQCTSNRILQLLEQVPDVSGQESVAPIPIHESASLQSVNSDNVVPRAQRQAALEVIRRNHELLQQEKEQAESELGYSSDDEDWHDWGNDGDNASDDD